MRDEKIFCDRCGIEFGYTDDKDIYHNGMFRGVYDFRLGKIDYLDAHERSPDLCKECVIIEIKEMLDGKQYPKRK